MLMMESPQADDDICILKYETELPAESPVAVCSGDESVASHFALVTAYEDIKKRLRETERENTLLRKRVKQLEDKRFKPEAPPSEGPQYMNKAFSAYREIYMEKKDLQAELSKLKKERAESEKILNEQLQMKELELLQLRSEMETSQVMKSLSETQDYWQVKQEGDDVQINNLQKEIHKLKVENSHLHTLCNLTQDVSDSAVKTNDSQQVETKSTVVMMMRLYEDVCSEMSRLQSVISTQSEVMKKLRDRPALRRAASALPVQCLDDMERNHSPVRAPISRAPSAPPLQIAPPTGPPAENWKEAWTLTRPSPLGSPANPPQHGTSSLDNDSWSIPAHTLFCEGPKSSSAEWSKPY